MLIKIYIYNMDKHLHSLFLTYTFTQLIGKKGNVRKDRKAKVRPKLKAIKVKQNNNRDVGHCL